MQLFAMESLIWGFTCQLNVSQLHRLLKWLGIDNKRGLVLRRMVRDPCLSLALLTSRDSVDYFIVSNRATEL